MSLSRPGVWLWVNAAGDGVVWRRHHLAQYHNKAVPNKTLRFERSSYFAERGVQDGPEKGCRPDFGNASLGCIDAYVRAKKFMFSIIDISTFLYN